jgi:hypothetical protein
MTYTISTHPNVHDDVFPSFLRLVIHICISGDVLYQFSNFNTKVSKIHFFFQYLNVKKNLKNQSVLILCTLLKCITYLKIQWKKNQRRRLVKFHVKNTCRFKNLLIIWSVYYFSVQIIIMNAVHQVVWNKFSGNYFQLQWNGGVPELSKLLQQPKISKTSVYIIWAVKICFRLHVAREVRVGYHWCKP